MSTPAKATVLRALLPNDGPSKIALALGTAGKTESKIVTLASGDLTTEAIVGRIKELSKLRDEILQVMRHLNVAREASPSQVDRLGSESEMESARQELEDTRNQYQEVQGKIENVQRQIEDSKRRIVALEEMSQTGFASDHLESETKEFRRVLGRLPVKKLEPAQKAMVSQFRDQAVLAVGNRKQDSFYILVAAPKDKYSQALQTLLLYDFTPIEIPEYKSPNFKSEIQTQEDRANVPSKDLEKLKLQQDDLRRRAGRMLNRRLDEVIDALMLFRGILKLGDGTQASHIYTRLERVLPAETMSQLTRSGIVELEPSS